MFKGIFSLMNNYVYIFKHIVSIICFIFKFNLLYQNGINVNYQ